MRMRIVLAYFVPVTSNILATKINGAKLQVRACLFTAPENLDSLELDIFEKLANEVNVIANSELVCNKYFY